ncbi:glycosyltransferase [Acinetobacter sp. ANC 5378]|uniref:glycosyltransferase family 2 protein n=1 Tax=Acinetobacter sp. ANC 5378 TaxID=2731249 RepID=UPI00148FB473|nr:glycosyltransferase [Acinetobacter sp. ANC 5378]NNG81649.1 glycosyltransferase [Acinetobacter sp. ANC 5378]
MTTPLVSIIIASYNHEKFVQDSIQSVINQSYKNIELIIIDDGSQDASIEKIQALVLLCEQTFTRFEFRHRPNKGLSATLNEAIEWCEGKYIAALASDDAYLPEKTSHQIKIMENRSDIVALFGNINYINENNIIRKTDDREKREYLFDDILLNNHIIHSSTQLIRTSAIKDVGGYNPMIVIEDLYMWLKLVKIGKIFVDDHIVTNYRLHDNNSIKRTTFIYNGCLDVLREYSEHPLYFRAIYRMSWGYAAAIALENKKNSLKILRNILIISPFSIFSKNFLRYIRNLLIK